MTDRELHALGMRDGFAALLAEFRASGKESFAGLRQEIDKRPAVVHSLGVLAGYQLLFDNMEKVGEKAALREIARLLQLTEPEHPHAKWIMENV